MYRILLFIKKNIDKYINIKTIYLTTNGNKL